MRTGKRLRVVGEALLIMLESCVAILQDQEEE
jgi:hypothetical protein